MAAGTSLACSDGRTDGNIGGNLARQTPLTFSDSWKSGQQSYIRLKEKKPGGMQDALSSSRGGVKVK